MKKLIYATSTRFPRAVRKPPRTTSYGVSLGPLFPQESQSAAWQAFQRPCFALWGLRLTFALRHSGLSLQSVNLVNLEFPGQSREISALKNGSSASRAAVAIILLLCECDRFDFDEDVFWKTGDFHAGTCRLMIAEVRRINLIDRAKIIHILDEYSGFDDAVK